MPKHYNILPFERLEAVEDTNALTESSSEPDGQGDLGDQAAQTADTTAAASRIFQRSPSPVFEISSDDEPETPAQAVLQKRVAISAQTASAKKVPDPISLPSTSMGYKVGAEEPQKGGGISTQSTSTAKVSEPVCLPSTSKSHGELLEDTFDFEEEDGIELDGKCILRASIHFWG